MIDVLPPAALPRTEPHAHPHHGAGHEGHGHQHAHHPHAHHHHGHTHHHPTPAAPAAGFSLLALSGMARLMLALPPVGLLWLLTLWAL